MIPEIKIPNIEIAIAEIPDYYLDIELNIPKTTPVTLSIGSPIIQLPGCIEYNPANKKSNKLSSLLFVNNNLHIDILFDQSGNMEINNPEGNQDKLKIHDIILESAISTICDHEDSVAAVDAEDKVIGYRNWLGLMKGNLKAEFIKKSKKNIRKLNSDRNYISKEGKKIKLHGRSLLLNRNVGHLMLNPAILLGDGSEVPEGIMDAFITSLCAIHDIKKKKNSKTGSIYIVKPKMHGPDECKFTDLIFENVLDLDA